MNRLYLLSLVLFIISISCYHEDHELVDSRDGNRYEIIDLYGHTWTLDNMRYIEKALFCNGAWVYPFEEDDYKKAISSNTAVRNGVLYDLSCAKKICPEGWKLPSVEEWTILINGVKSNDPKEKIDLGDLKLVFDGFARSSDRFCVFDGVTFWTSTPDKVDPGKGYVIIIQILSDASLVCRFESQPATNAFPVRLIKTN